MSAAVFEQREVWVEKLYRLLPGVYRARDTRGDLRAFLGLFADELLRVRASLDQQLDDHFVDSCQDWVLPYLADLVGTEVLYSDASLNRIDIQNTVRWRRAKGTRAGLEDMAQGVSGFGALAADMLERAVWLQNLAHLRPDARFCLDLRDRNAMAALNTAFARAPLTQDLRPPALRGGGMVGMARATHTAVYVWPIQSHPLRGAWPVALGGGRFRFCALGLDQALYAGGEVEQARVGVGAADLDSPHVDDIPLRLHDARRHAARYVNSAAGFSINEDGIAVCAAAVSAGALPPTSLESNEDFAQLARQRGLKPGDATLFGATQDFRLEAVRLAAVVTLVGNPPAITPIEYSPGLPFAGQLTLRNAHGTLQLDGATPDFSYSPGVMPYTPGLPEFHHPALLLRLVNVGAVAAFPESEAVLRNARGLTLQVFLPAVAVMPAGAELYLYVSRDGSTCFARGDHAFGLPDRNPDAGAFGAFLPAHLARAAEAQVRLTTGHPTGATRTRRAVIRSLCCWDQPLVPPLASGEVAIDPERGRFMFPPGEIPQGTLSVDYRFGLTAPIGAGPFDRGILPARTITVARELDAQHASIQAAIDAAPDGATQPVIIEILDSATYVETLSVLNRNFPGGLILQATTQQTPTVTRPAGLPPALRVSNSTLGSLQLDGIRFDGGVWQLQGDIGAVALRHCALTPASVGLSLISADADFTASDCILGPVDITAPRGKVTLSDCVVQHPAATVERPHGQWALQARGAALTVERCTLIGDLAATSAYVSNTLLYGDAVVTDLAASCWRFSRIPAALHPPRAFRTTSATPIFLTLQYGAAGYCHLHPNTSAALRAGGEEGGEIGAFHQAGIAWRLQNLARRLAEYAPAGATAFVIPVLPRLAFRGNLPS